MNFAISPLEEWKYERTHEHEQNGSAYRRAGEWESTRAALENFCGYKRGNDV